MSSNPRLISKLDDALAIVRKQRSANYAQAAALCGKLRERFGSSRPFEIRVGGATHTIRPDAVRISKTRIDFGPIELPLFAVTDCQHGEDAQGEPVYGLGVHTDDMDVVPLAIA